MARFVSLVLTVIFLSAGFAFSPAPATARQLFKIASLAPEGSVWVESFKDFAAEVTEKTGGEVDFRIYPGGVMGDDRAMYRKMRVGQLHGGGFTMTGIADIVPDFRVMAIPFLFRSYDEVDQVSGDLQPLFTDRFADEGLRFVAMTEVGFIYTFSTRARTTIDDLRQAKTWAPSNDPLSSAFFESLGISPISLNIPDVLSSLQTGLIDTAFNSLYGSIVLQWFTKAPFVTDQPYGYAYGAFIMDGKAFARLSPEQQAIIDTAADNHFPALISKTRQSNEESRAVLMERGVSFVPTSEQTVATLEEHRDLTIDKLVGQAFSEEIFAAVTASLDRLRPPAGNNDAP
jgi:TRAP-type C4-dicarboxylate transport system substrate-binding protein